MPGICGWTSLDESANGESTRGLFGEMVASLAYGRGSEHQRYELPVGHLASVHLPGACQATACADGAVRVVFQGYITDRVVGSGKSVGARGACHILALYRRHGENFVEHLEGAFAIALWDGDREQLILANDRFGLRPIYYSEDRRGLRFASEAKALITDPDQDRALDHDGLASLLLLGLPYHEVTLFQSVRVIPAGTTLVWKSGRSTLRKYWSLEYPARRRTRSMKEAAERVFEAMDGAVERMTAPHLRFGIMLSGGLDSRWLAASLADRCDDVTAFTFGSEQCDDYRVAAEVAKTLGFRHVRKDLDPDYLARYAEQMVYVTDGMYNVIHGHEFPLVSSINGDVDVVTGGFLGDVLFGRNVTPRTILVRNDRDSVVDYAFGTVRRKNLQDCDVSLLFEDDVATRLRESARTAFEDSYPDLPHALDMMEYQHIVQRHRRWYYSSQMLKAPFVEMYHPFTDLDVIEAGLELSLEQRLLQRAYRRAFCDHFPDLARIPWTLTSLPTTAATTTMLLQRALSRSVGRLLPRSLSDRVPMLRMQRMPTNYPEWIRGPLRPFIESVLLDGEVGPPGLIRPGAMGRFLDDHMSGRRDLTTSIGLLLTFQLWYRAFGKGTPRPPAALRSHERIDN